MMMASAGEHIAGSDQQIESSHQAASSPAARLVLASASPRRQDLLREARYRFIIDPADIDESEHPPGLSPPELVVYLAEQKATVVFLRHPNLVVLAADTVVALGNDILGKPAKPGAARLMLERLSGTSHAVLTGVAIRSAHQTRSACVRSNVHMRRLTAAEIEEYVAGEQWRGKAGGYGIQDPDPFVTRIAGSETNIVGLPMKRTRKLLTQAGIYPDPSPP